MHVDPSGEQLTGVGVGLTGQHCGGLAQALRCSTPFTIKMGQPPGGVALQIYPAGQSALLVQR